MTWDLGGEGGNSFPFDNIGDFVTGQIVDLREQQQTDLGTGDPKTFANGDPMMMYRVTLATQLRNPDNPGDDGHRDVYLKGSRKAGCQSSLAAVLDAVKTVTGGTELEPNATLTLQYVGNGVASQRGHSAPKLYAAQYVRPTMNLGAPAPAQAPVVQQPVYQAPPQPQYAPTPAQQPQPVYQAPPQPQYAPTPAQQPQPVYQAPQAPVLPQQPIAPQPAPQPVTVPGGPTPEQIAALRAAGVDPASVFPGFAG